jgi:hypothetical protein
MEREAIEQRREIEDQALALGDERSRLQQGLGENRRAIVALLDAATEHGIAVEQFARLVGLTRASLYRWRDSSKETNG